MPPIKRSPELVTLSHEHYDGLKFCRNLKLGEKQKAGTSRIAGYIQWFWENHLQHHFYQEETLLFKAVENELIPRALEEHGAIQKLVAEAIKNPSYESNIQIANLVNDHIRYEERELFPALEKQMDPETITRIGKALQAAHIQGCTIQYQDQFWI